MNTALIFTIIVVWFVLVYRWYAGRVEKTLVEPDDSRSTPAEKFKDGMDYVPTRPFLLFGHHFAAIAGAGPIIGPILATSQFGWLGTLLWIVFGAAFIGAVHDYLSMTVSVRMDGKTIPVVTEQTVGKRSRQLFVSFVWLALFLVIAVFYDVAIKTLVTEPRVVIPTVALIPISMLAGVLVYKFRVSGILASVVALGLLAYAMYLGDCYPIVLPYSADVNYLIWLVVFVVYTIAASVFPVWLLLQPRGYISTYLLFIGMGIGIFGLYWSHPSIVYKPVEAFVGEDGPMWPMMFILVACGAASGFHSIIASGTSCKQLAKESDAKLVSFGAMLAEAVVAVFVTLAVAAVVWKDLAPGSSLPSVLSKEGPIAVFSKGYGSVTASFLKVSIGILFCISMVNAFVVTTLDTCVRLGRLITADLFHDPWGLSKSYWFGTLLISIPSALLAWSGKFSLIWPIFGAANQLVGALTLIVLTAYFLQRGKPSYFTLYPAVFMLITTIAALIWQGYHYCLPAKGNPDYVLAGMAFILLALAVVVTIESWDAIRKSKKIAKGNK